MRVLHGVNQKKQDRLVFNFICQKNSVNPQQVREDMREQGYENLTPSVVTNFIKENY
jgi:hypothetical protein